MDTAPSATPPAEEPVTTPAAPSAVAEPAPSKPVPAPREHRTAWSLEDTRYIVNVERLTSLLFWSSHGSGHGASTTRTGADFSALVTGARSPASAPRVGLDFVVPADITVGASAGVVGSVGDGADFRMFLASMRVGKLTAITPTWRVWTRGGLVYTRINTEGASGTSTPARLDERQWYLNLLLDPQLVWSPAPHLAITLGPLIEVGVAGGTSRDADLKLTYSAYGFAFGACALF